MTARPGPHGGSVPALAVLPGLEVWVALLEAEERAGGPGMPTSLFYLSSLNCGGTPERQGLLRP